MLRLTVTLSCLFLASVALTGSLGLAAPLPAPEASPAPDLAGGIAFAKQSTAWQAQQLGIQVPASFPTPAHAHPSEAILALAARHGVTPSAEQAARVASLDLLPAAQAKALTRVVDAFLGVEDATAQAFAHADPALLHWLAGHPASATAGHARQAGIDYAPIFAARNQLLDASLALSEAWPSLPASPQSAPPTLDLCPALALDTDGLNTDYWYNCALIVDVGGHDYYGNNAGGSGCPIANPGAGALLDLAGHDRYTSYGACGVNGGGRLGSGFLLDKAGDDDYYASDSGVNGGGDLGSGFLLDAGGRDYYYGNSGGVNGGGWSGVGSLIDLNGDDIHQAQDLGTNGGGSVGGVGLLADLGGYDSYYAGSSGANGGGDNGVGLLLDTGGYSDFYSDSTGWNWDWTNAPKGTLGAQVDVDLCWEGVDLEQVGACGTFLCPSGLTSPPGPGQVAVVCGTPVDEPCPQGVNANTLAACGVGPLCPTGVTSPASPGQLAVVCGVPVNDPCPQGADPDYARVCTVVLCPTGLRENTDPGELAVVCGQTVPCPPQVHVNCPSPCSSGITSPPGAGELAVVCGFPVPAPVGIAPACSDGVDNDSDGRTDYRPGTVGGGDPECSNPLDNNEGA